MDSLRYWVEEMHVDGFRFDLAVDARARSASTSTTRPRFLTAVPPGPGARAGEAHRRAVGRRARRLPGRRRSRCAGRSGTASTATSSAASGRATMGSLAELGYRLTGSADLYERGGPEDLRERELRHRPRRVHAARSRLATTRSTTRRTARRTATAPTTTTRWNCGVEGETDDPAVNALRDRQQRNLIATLFVSQGVPMLTRRRRDREDAGGQQQRLLPGQRDLVARLGARRPAPRAPRLRRGG